MKLLAGVGGSEEKGTSEYGIPDVIWTNSKTGGQVFVGDETAAREAQTLESKGINFIINCQGMESINFHKANDQYVYLRFPIGNHYWSPFDMKTNEGILRYFLPLFEFVEWVTSNGKNCLIHCLAGAHRAGTTGCAWLMYVNDSSVNDAINLG